MILKDVIKFIEFFEKETPEEYKKILIELEVWQNFIDNITLNECIKNLTVSGSADFKKRYKKACQKPFNEFIYSTLNFSPQYKFWAKVSMKQKPLP